MNYTDEDGHRAEITDIQLSPDGTYIITASKDKTARVSRSCPFTDKKPNVQMWDSDTLEEMKVFSTETPLNSACIAPLRPYVSSHLRRSRNTQPAGHIRWRTGCDERDDDWLARREV